MDRCNCSHEVLPDCRCDKAKTRAKYTAEQQDGFWYLSRDGERVPLAGDEQFVKGVAGLLNEHAGEDVELGGDGVTVSEEADGGK